MKKLFLALFLSLSIFTLAACNIESLDNDSNVYQESVENYSYLAVDINPSIEFILDEDEIVKTINPINEDAELVIADIELIGLTVDEALEVYLETAIDLGYLDTDESFVNVTLETEDETLEERIKDRANATFERKQVTALVMMGGAVDETLTDLVETYGISMGKARMVRNVLTLETDYDEAELAEMNPNELMGFLVNNHLSQMQNFREQRQQSAREMASAMRELHQGRNNHETDQGNPNLDSAEQGQSMRETMQERMESYRNQMEERKEAARNNAQRPSEPVVDEDEATDEEEPVVDEDEATDEEEPVVDEDEATDEEEQAVDEDEATDEEEPVVDEDEATDEENPADEEETQNQ